MQPTTSSQESFGRYQRHEKKPTIHETEDSLEKLICDSKIPRMEMEIAPRFFKLHFPDQIGYIEYLLAEVFEGETGHNDPLTIEYRKRISNELRLVKNEVDLRMAISDVRIGRADAAIKFFRANPHRIKSFFAELVRQYPDESKTVTLSILDHLLEKLRKPAN